MGIAENDKTMKELFTIGHSVHSVERFLELLKMHGINAVCDVRSSPYSRFTPQFNRETLKEEILRRQLSYGRSWGREAPIRPVTKMGRFSLTIWLKKKFFNRGSIVSEKA